MHISILVNGSNDLYYSLKKSISDLISNLKDIKGVSISIVYTFLIDEKNIWTFIESDSLSDEVGYLEYEEGILRRMKYQFKNENTSLDIKSAIAKTYKPNKKNILIISGHGGPFQCMLDMSNNIDKSFSTYELCSIINQYEYEVVFLDMCAMNFIEVLYEILYTKKVSGIITYKGLAVFEGLNYLEIIKVLRNSVINKEIIDRFEYAFIYISSESINNFNELKKVKDSLVKKCVLAKNPNFNTELFRIRELIDKSVYESRMAKEIRIEKLNYIKYYLESEVDRAIYSKYLYLENNLWRQFLFMDGLNEEYKNYIELSRESLKNIISLHNTNKNNVELDYLIELYYKNKKRKQG
ncbi:hypothetical protein [uncultured Clostridium sp.]|jgi:hypothetical protein|uniref:hypothetical protein n=1 Tax=uncultured Clostridium sp. TaxID=59620 RepID=UPI00261656B9|nr:hypothetical protein [uncultured Clostridium sp.]